TFTATGAGTGTGTVDPYLGQDSGIQRFRDLELYGTISQPEALRHMRIELERARHELTLVLPLKGIGLCIQPGDYIDFSESRYGWTNKLFEVRRLKTILQQVDGGVAIGFDAVV